MTGLLPKKVPSKRICEEGIVSEVVYPNKEWRVEYRASYWTARSSHSKAFKPGDFVHVVGIDTDSLMLLIEPL